MNPTKLEQRETRRPKGVVTLWPQEVTIGNEKQPSILQVYNLARKQIISKLLLLILASQLDFWNWLQPRTRIIDQPCTGNGERRAPKVPNTQV